MLMLALALLLPLLLLLPVARIQFLRLVLRPSSLEEERYFLGDELK